MSSDLSPDYKPSYLHFLNFLDALFTLFVVSGGVPEANPILDYALNFGPMPFLLLKFVAVACAIEIMDNLLSGLRRAFFFNSLIVIMCIVVCWHIYGLMLIARFEG